MAKLVPIEDLLISRRNEIALAPNFTLLHTAHPPETFYALLREYAACDQCFQLVVDCGSHTRRQAALYMLQLSAHLALWIREEKLVHTVEWWYCTPSDVGRGTLAIAFRPLGIYEMTFI